MANSPAKTLLAWSSGKDSAYALLVLRDIPEVKVVGLLTTLNSYVHRVSLHGVRRAVLEAQARACGLELRVASLPDSCTNHDYQRVMTESLDQARAEGVEAIAFGDIFLADVRAYREKHLAGTGITPIFPLWGKNSCSLAHEIIEVGIDAIITCIDSEKLDPSFLGRRFDHTFLTQLPDGVDPCGENGEFHTVAVGGPMFTQRLDVELGEVVDRGRFLFVDVLLREK